MKVENITLNGQLVEIRLNPNGTRQLDLADGSQVTLPKKATVFAGEEVVELPTGEAGVFMSLRQDPRVKIPTFKEFHSAEGKLTHLVAYEPPHFLGIKAGIDQYGNVVPPELPDLIKRVRESWGWEIDQETLKAFGQASLGLAEK